MTLNTAPILDLAPPPEGAFSTYDILFSSLQKHAKEHGFAVAVGKSKRDRDGTIRTRYIQCVKSGKPRDRVIDRKKPFISQKTDCPFRCRAHYTSNSNCEDEGQWELSVTIATHNHDPNNPAAYYQHRKFSSVARDRVSAMTRAGIAPKEIASSLTIEYPELTWTIQDIYNLRRELRAKLLEGRSPIEAMIHELEVSNFEFNYQIDIYGYITLLFFTHPESLLLLKQYPEVLLMDCTYKTNRFYMPLLDILGSTSLNRTFFVVFIFLSGETEDDYSYALNMLRKVMDIRNITYPGIIVTDKDQGLMNAIQQTFSSSHNLLCGWHINKNVLSYVREMKLYEKESQEEESVMTQWYLLVSSKTEKDFDQRWIEFQMKW
jgi:MULE transposase domain/FAR1 DNA-binding domain